MKQTRRELEDLQQRQLRKKTKKELRIYVTALLKELKEKEYTIHEQSKQIQGAQNQERYAKGELEDRIRKTQEMSPEEFKRFLRDHTGDFLCQKRYSGITLLVLQARIYATPERHYQFSKPDEFKMEFVLKED